MNITWHRAFRGLISILLFVAMLCLVTARQAAAAPVADSSAAGAIIVGHPFPVPLFRLKDGDPHPVCGAALDGATALTADGTLCVCRPGPRGGTWLLAGAGTACWPQRPE